MKCALRIYVALYGLKSPLVYIMKAWPKDFRNTGICKANSIIVFFTVLILASPAHSHRCKYRPISLLLVVGEVAEAVILSSLKSFVDASHAFPVFYFGFQQGHFTMQKLN
jgi:hypothetical protein